MSIVISIVIIIALIIVIFVLSRKSSQETKERKSAEGELQLFRELLDRSTDAFYIIEPKTASFVDVSNAACKALGYSREELLTLSVLDISPDVGTAFWDKHVEQLREKGEMTLENRHARKDKTTFPVQIRVTYLKQREKDYILAQVRDISESSKTDEELRRYHAIVDQSGDSLFILDAESASILEVNAGACNFLGYSHEEFLDMRTPDISSYFNDMQGWNSAVSRLSQTEDMVMETEHRRKDGSFANVETRAKLVTEQNKDYVVIVARGITEREIPNEMLNMLSVAVEQSPVAILFTEADGKIRYVNEQFCEITGYSLDELIGENPKILKSGYQTLDFYRKMWETISMGRVWEGEFHNRKKDGETFWESATIVPVKNAQGQVTHYVGLKEDITERKGMEEWLRTFSLVVEQSKSSTLILDTNMCINYVNPAAEEMTGYKADELIGENVDILRSGEHSGDFYASIWAKGRLGEAWLGNVSSKRKNGEVIKQAISISPVLDPEGEIMHFISIMVEDEDMKS